MGAAVAVGLTVISLALIGVDRLRAAAPAANPGEGPALYLLTIGTLGGLLAAGVVAWWLLAPILSLYRRGGLSIVSAFATVLAMLLCIPAHQLAGSAGLAVLAAALLLAVVLGRWSRRLAMVP
jgi:hypothetical protein